MRLLARRVVLVSLAVPGQAEGAALQARWQERQDIDGDGLRAGAAWWSGFASGQPAQVQALAGHGSYPGALTETAGWHLQRFPGRYDGLTGPERALLGLLDGDPAPFPELFARWQETPLAKALGLADRQVAALLRDLSRDEALVHVVNPADGDLAGWRTWRGGWSRRCRTGCRGWSGRGRSCGWDRTAGRPSGGSTREPAASPKGSPRNPRAAYDPGPGRSAARAR